MPAKAHRRQLKRTCQLSCQRRLASRIRCSTIYVLMKQYYVYIMASEKNGTLYTGFTSNLIRRVYQHRVGAVDCFTSQYKRNKLVYYEITIDALFGIKREKNIQSW